MPSTTPWKIVEAERSNDLQPSSLKDIMSEQLAQELEEEFVLPSSSHESGQAVVPELKPTNDVVDETTLSDHMLAMVLQKQFDQEHDDELRARERALNKNDKVAISYANYNRSQPEDLSDQSDDDEDDYYREESTHKKYNPSLPKFGAAGLTRVDGVTISKHDSVVAGRRNTSRVLRFPPEFKTGDAAGMDMKLPNRVYNDLRVHSTTEERRRRRLHDKQDKATAELALDPRTRLILFKFIDNGMLQSIGGQVATGKESTVLHAYGCPTNEAEINDNADDSDADENENDEAMAENDRQSQASTPHNSQKTLTSNTAPKFIPEECAIKIYKTTLSEFKNRADYVTDDYRFKKTHKIIRLWADKERLNLNRLYRAGIPCPRVVKLKHNVLVMEFIGNDGRPAPRLRDVNHLSDAQLADAYSQVAKAMTTMYSNCALVHGDLSEYNVLYHNHTCYLIDVSQSVDTSHPRALTLLLLDCRHVLDFFGRQRQLDGLPSERELFNQITGLDMRSDETLDHDVASYTLENRSVQQRRDKKNPADCELRKHIEDAHSQRVEVASAPDQ